MSAITRTIAKWGTLALYTLYFLVGIGMLFFGAPFFLHTFFSLQAGEEAYYMDAAQPNITLPAGDYILSVKVVTDILKTLDKHHYPLALLLPLQSKLGSDGDCPVGFTTFDGPSSVDNLVYPCVRYFLEELSFDALISTDSDVVGAQMSGLGSHPHTQVDFAVTLGETSTSLSASLALLRFENASRADCGESRRCRWLSNQAVEDADGLDYAPGSVRCYSQYEEEFKDFVYTGCAIELESNEFNQCRRTGRDDTAGHDDTFQFSYLLAWYLKPPGVLWTIWNWGSLVFFNLYFVWALLSFLFFRVFHLDYLRLFYFTDVDVLVFLFKKRYECKLYVTGEAFTHAEGRFSIFHVKNGATLYSWDFDVDFPDEDLEGERVSTVLLYTWFVAPYDCIGDFKVEWSREFMVANAVVPGCEVQIRETIPWLLKVPSNVVLMPLYAFLAFFLCAPPFWRIRRLPQYLLLLIMNTAALASFLICFFYVASAFLPDLGTDPPVFWGNPEARPLFPIALYVLFVCVIFAAMLSSYILLVARWRRSQAHDTTPDQIIAYTGRTTGSVAMSIGKSRLDPDSADQTMMHAPSTSISVTDPSYRNSRQDHSLLTYVELQDM